MVNTYYKLLNSKIEAEQRQEFITSVQNDLRNSDDSFWNDAFQSGKSSINNLLRYYVFNQILKDCSDLDINKNKPKYYDTPNQDIKKDANNNYFKHNFKNKSETIVEVLENGNYITISNIFNSSYKIKKEYDNEDSLIYMQILSNDNQIIREKWQAIQLLGMKKELAEIHKYSGFSGNSNDVVAYILNKLSKPKETGYYMDGKFNFYSWNETHSAFYSQTACNKMQPYLTDYDFLSNNTVLRKEYTGIC